LKVQFLRRSLMFCTILDSQTYITRYATFHCIHERGCNVCCCHDSWRRGRLSRRIQIANGLDRPSFNTCSALKMLNARRKKISRWNQPLTNSFYRVSKHITKRRFSFANKLHPYYNVIVIFYIEIVV